MFPYRKLIPAFTDLKDFSLKLATVKHTECNNRGNMIPGFLLQLNISSIYKWKSNIDRLIEPSLFDVKTAPVIFCYLKPVLKKNIEISCNTKPAYIR